MGSGGGGQRDTHESTAWQITKIRGDTCRKQNSQRASAHGPLISVRLSLPGSRRWCGRQATIFLRDAHLSRLQKARSSAGHSYRTPLDFFHRPPLPANGRTHKKRKKTAGRPAPKRRRRRRSGRIFDGQTVRSRNGRPKKNGDWTEILVCPAHRVMNLIAA